MIPESSPFVWEFGAKAEVGEDAGEGGVHLRGYGTRFGERDSEGEVMEPGALASIAEEWGDPTNRAIIYNHGFSPELGTRRIARVLDYSLDERGLAVHAFLPEQPPARWSAKAQDAYRQVYRGVREGAIRGFSVQGIFRKLGHRIVGVAMNELSIAPRPILASADFMVGMKAMTALFAAEACPTCGGSLAETPPLAADQHKAEEDRGGYLVIEPDGTKHLPTKKGGSYDRGLCGAAWAALHSGYRGQKYQGPNKAAAIAKLKRIYASQGWDLPGEAESKAIVLRYLEERKAGRRHSARTLALVGQAHGILGGILREGAEDRDLPDAGAMGTTPQRSAAGALTTTTIGGLRQPTR